ncbi:MAG: hypothetical protein HY235_27180 [Acidobacteria bacterium]|nr:hypothetical protein [Acidobacteriota bacterium]
MKDVQCDEIWSFIQKKEKLVQTDDDPHFGDACCFVAIECHSKLDRATPEGERYSPAEVVSTEVVPICGQPDPKRICTSHVDGQTLTMRTNIRRFTRLTNGL